MMQQQMCQPDQLSQQPMAQQMAQQMVLCPVKVVYETQILVPPGEQIQPNQTIFINPQNTPPWIQNRMQNQVYYVQQMPNNIVPTIQQNIDPNQMYIQSYPYQMTQQMVTQNPQEQRPMQIQNMPQQYSVVQTVSNANLPERTVQMTNYCQMQNQIVPNRQQASNIGVSVPNQQQQINEVQRTFINVRPQIHQYLSNVRPQVMSNHNVNMTQNVNQTLATIPPRPVQISSQNMSNIQRMVATSLPNTPPRVNAPTFAVPNNVQMTQKPVESVLDSNIVPRHSIPTTAPKITNVQSYTFKTVQPRPQYRHNVPNIGKLMQPTQHINVNVYKDRINTNNQVNMETSQFNRKRKSESPDEVYKKMIVNPASRDNNTQTINTKESVSNVQKNVLNENTILQITNNGAQLVKFNEPVPATTTSSASQTDKEKLLRNTVFTQAKGRVLSDKEIMPKEIIKTDVKSDKETIVKNEHCITIVKMEKLEEKECKVEKDIKKEIKKEEVLEQKEPEKKIPEEVQEQKIEFKEKLLNGHQILTHVLDGFVIQESNVAFPIRKPLKERTLSLNGKEIKEEGDDVKESKDRIPIDLPLLPFHFLQLHNKEEKQDNTEEEKEESPFAKLQKTVVKSWTVDQLADHMSKNNWNEPASIFRDHEIDGESLFLVSKAQLLNIGISEEHCDVICEFAKN